MAGKKGERFEILDSWRGICAIGVALLHGGVVSHIYAAPVLGNAWLFVDFFFVLSGFVISHAYFDGLTAQGDIAAFVIRRFGRVWPLHVAALGFMVFWELMEAVATRSLHMPLLPSDVFQNPRLALGSILANIALVQDIGLERIFAGPYQWNSPSWSISVEFYTYIIFALICVCGGRHANRLAAAAALFSIAAFAWCLRNGDPLDIFQLFQCIYGFILGHFVWRWAGKSALAPRSATIAEIAIVAGVIAYMAVSGAGLTRLLAPPIFGLAVWIFSGARGAVSGLLRKAPFLKVGALSYSIYMIHYLVLRVALTFAKAAGTFLHIQLISDHYMPYVGMAQFFDFGNPWFGDVFEVAYIATVIGISTFTFRYIEIPAKNFFYRKAKTLSARSAGSANC